MKKRTNGLNQLVQEFWKLKILKILKLLSLKNPRLDNSIHITAQFSSLHSKERARLKPLFLMVHSSSLCTEGIFNVKKHNVCRLLCGCAGVFTGHDQKGQNGSCRDAVEVLPVFHMHHA